MTTLTANKKSDAIKAKGTPFAAYLMDGAWQIIKHTYGASETGRKIITGGVYLGPVSDEDAARAKLIELASA